MDTKTFLKKIDLSPKKKAVLNYLQAKSLVKKSSGWLSELIVSIDEQGDDIFTADEYEELSSTKGERERFELEKWESILSLALNIDLMAERSYYKTFSLILVSSIKEKDTLKNIQDSIFNFYIYSFSAALINKVFYEQLDPECLKLLSFIRVIESGEQFDMKKGGEFKKVPLRDVYLNRKDEIIWEAKIPLKEIANMMEDYEYISDSVVERYIDETNELFQTILDIA